jgi:uncharacterized repeat protein (TIGR01451 family)
VISDNAGVGLAIRGWFSVGSRVVLNRNVIAGNGGSGIVLSEEHDFTMINNIIAANHSTQGAGIFLWGTRNPQGHPLVLNGGLYHNTIADNTPVGIMAGHNVTLTLVNNVLVSHTVGITTASDYGVPYVTADHTLYDGIGTYADTSGGGTVVTTNDVIGDPALVDHGDYHITGASAALDAGADAGVYTDIDCDTRPFGTSFDIGADEYAPLARSSVSAMLEFVSPGQLVAYTILLHNSDPATDLTTALTNPIPLHTAYVLGSARVDPPGWGDLYSDTTVITWSGEVSIAQPVTLTLQVQIHPRSAGASLPTLQPSMMASRSLSVAPPSSELHPIGSIYPLSVETSSSERVNTDERGSTSARLFATSGSGKAESRLAPLGVSY